LNFWDSSLISARLSHDFFTVYQKESADQAGMADRDAKKFSLAPRALAVVLI